MLLPVALLPAACSAACLPLVGSCPSWLNNICNHSVHFSCGRFPEASLFFQHPTQGLITFSLQPSVFQPLTDKGGLFGQFSAFLPHYLIFPISFTNFSGSSGVKIMVLSVNFKITDNFGSVAKAR